MRNNDYREERRHGEPDFPVEYYYIDAEHPRYEMQLHWHREFEMVRVLRGELLLYLDNAEQRLRAGDVAFVGSGTLHRAQPFACVYECVVFDLGLFARHGTGRITESVLTLLRSEVVPRPVSGDSVFFAPIEGLFTCLRERATCYELQAYGCMAQILSLLCREGLVHLPREGRPVEHRRQSMTLLLDWIRENYTERITLAHLAQLAKTNEKYLCRFFREYTGHTPIDYINRLRVESACLRMIEENATVTEAAFDSGFNDISYFCKIFKRYKGVTPREYRHTPKERT